MEPVTVLFAAYDGGVSIRRELRGEAERAALDIADGERRRGAAYVSVFPAGVAGDLWYWSAPARR